MFTSRARRWSVALLLSALFVPAVPGSAAAQTPTGSIDGTAASRRSQMLRAA